ncbi:MAG: hypothetical protein ACYC2U_01515 [Candidatus Amoebophilus sp.]
MHKNHKAVCQFVLSILSISLLLQSCTTPAVPMVVTEVAQAYSTR